MSKDSIHTLSRAVITEEGHILLCKTLDVDPPFYFLPGGHVEYAESAQETLLRELEEEGGLDASIEGFIGCFEHYFEPGTSSLCHNHEYNLLFRAKPHNLHSPENPPQKEEHIKLLWVPINTLNKIDFRPHFLRDIIIEWAKYDRSDSFKTNIHPS